MLKGLFLQISCNLTDRFIVCKSTNIYFPSTVAHKNKSFTFYFGIIKESQQLRVLFNSISTSFSCLFYAATPFWKSLHAWQPIAFVLTCVMKLIIFLWNSLMQKREKILRFHRWFDLQLHHIKTLKVSSSLWD